MNKVDVVVPCYNYAHFLEQCVASILTQEGTQVRVLIIDDASSDDTPEVGKRLAAADSRVEYRRHAKNHGHIATYNEGILGWASSDYYLSLSADDVLAPGALARATQLMDRHQDVGLTYGMSLVIDETKESIVVPDVVPSDYRIIPSAKFLQYCFEHGNAVPTPTAIVRTSLQHVVGGYRADLPHSGDMELWMRLAMRAPVAVLRATQAYYRIHGSNMSTAYNTRRLRDAREVLQACSEIASQCAAQFPEAPLWGNATRRRLGEDALGAASSAFNDGDQQGRDSCLQFAREVYPGRLQSSDMWWRLQLKILVGQSLWQRGAPLVSRLRGREYTPPLPMDERRRVGAVDGWWPGDLEQMSLAGAR